VGPLHFKHIAFKVFGIPVIFDGPYVNELPSRLSCLAKREGPAARTVTGFFRKLTLCRGEGSFVLRDHALWNRPRSQVLLAPKWSSWVAKQHFNANALLPE
jgi:hypothetical protein